MGNVQTVQNFLKSVFTEHDVKFTNMLITNTSRTTKQVVTEIERDLHQINTVKTIKNIHRRTSILFDFKPHNEVTEQYCESLINIHFYGEENDLRNYRLCMANNQENGFHFSLAHFLKSMDSLLRSYGCTDISGYEEEFVYYLQGLMTERNYDYKKKEKFERDARKFLEIYLRRGCISEALHHDAYWGSHQQMLAGKVIADFIDADYGALDPVFGVLLSPVAGRVGPGDSGIVHEMLYDHDGPLSYHAASHDAFGYLISYHVIGPGYDYLNCGSIFHSSQCMSGQISGIVFWKGLLQRNENKLDVWI